MLDELNLDNFEEVDVQGITVAGCQRDGDPYQGHVVLINPQMVRGGDSMEDDAKRLYDFLRLNLPEETWAKLFELMGIEAAQVNQVARKIDLVLMAETITFEDRLRLAEELFGLKRDGVVDD